MKVIYGSSIAYYEEAYRKAVERGGTDSPAAKMYAEELRRIREGVKDKPEEVASNNKPSE